MIYTAFFGDDPMFSEPSEREFRTVVRKTPGSEIIIFMLLVETDARMLIAGIAENNKPAAYEAMLLKMIKEASSNFPGDKIAVSGVRKVAIESPKFAGVKLSQKDGLPSRIVNRLAELNDVVLDADREKMVEDELLLLIEAAKTDPMIMTPKINDRVPIDFDETFNSMPVEIPKDVPSALMIGGAGAGKSTLIGEIFGIRAKDIPPSGVSRTTISPIILTNIPSEDGMFELSVTFKDHDEVLESIAERVSEAVRERKESRVINALLSSDDNTFDMRCFFGEKEEAQIYCSEIISDIFDVQSLSSHEMFEDMLHNGEITDAIAKKIIEKATDKICEVSFGHYKWENRFPEIFKYRSRSFDAVLEASRRFISTNRKHRGFSFAPFVGEVRISGQMLSAPAFSLIDHRGIDHENGEGPIPDDVVRVAASADRIVIVENCEKPGSRETVRAINDLFARGLGKPLVFVGTKSDSVTDRGEDPETKMIEGIRNATAAIGRTVGPSIAESIRAGLERCPPLFFGGLHDPWTTPLHEREDENSPAANRLILEVSRKVGDTNPFSLYQAGLEYSRSELSSVIRNSFSRIPEIVRQHYGDDGKNSTSDHHWGTIKAEGRRLFIAMEKGYVVTHSSTRLTSFITRDIMDGLSKFLDAPAVTGDVPGMSKEDLLSLTDDLRRASSAQVIKFIVDELLRGEIKSWQKMMVLSEKTFGRGSTIARGEGIRDIADSFSKKDEPLIGIIISCLARNFVKIQ